MIPWQVKLGTKLVLSRLPIPHWLWHRIGAFRHGSMESAAYGLSVFRSHFKYANLPSPNQGFVALELGPGDSVVSGIIAAAHGATRTLLVDTGDFATRNMPVYHAMANYLQSEGLDNCIRLENTDFRNMLRSCRTDYLTEGLASLRRIGSSSIDFIWSQAVLEHVRLHEFDEVLYEFRRILRSGGICSHTVDLRDHLGGALNNLRFSRARWESPVFAGSGFYTNRIRHSDMLRRFAAAGFAVEVLNRQYWPAVPTPVEALDTEFRRLPAEELRVLGFQVVLRLGS